MTSFLFSFFLLFWMIIKTNIYLSLLNQIPFVWYYITMILLYFIINSKLFTVFDHVCYEQFLYVSSKCSGQGVNIIKNMKNDLSNEWMNMMMKALFLTCHSFAFQFIHSIYFHCFIQFVSILHRYFITIIPIN